MLHKNSTSPAPPRSDGYVMAMEHLVGVVQQLSQARDVDAVASIVRQAARNLTGADGATFVLRDGDQCYYAEENAIAPLWKGRRFPMSACVSGWVMLHAQPAVIEDIYADPRVPADAYRPTFVKSMAMVPIRRASPIGAIGNYWAKQRRPTAEEVTVLQALADTTAVALENADLYGRLKRQVRVLQEQQDQIREQHESLAVFTHALAHDLKEPVRTLTSYIRMLDDMAESAADRGTYVRFIRSAADRMGLLIDSVFRYTQLDDPAPVNLALCEMGDILAGVRENLAQLIAQRRATLEWGQLPPVHADAGQMTQLVQNLVANAIRHNREGIRVIVQAEATPDQWQFIVRDNGVGFAPEHAERVFEPFKRLAKSDDCAGLGLAICRKIVTRHGGTIRAESRPGEGAAFVFTLPRPPAASTDASPSLPSERTAPEPIDPALACMLLVDDREDDMLMTSILLSKRAKLKCHLRSASGGEEALDVIRREPVDVMLLDINMPGMDGFDVLEHMQRHDLLSKTPVIMCTGSTYDKDMERAKSLGASAYLVKPPTFEHLRPMLEAVPTVRLTSHDDGYVLLRADA